MKTAAWSFKICATNPLKRTTWPPDVDKLTMETAAPLQLGSDGRYPVPQPGIIVDREY
jgi:hypothetical protein